MPEKTSRGLNPLVKQTVERFGLDLHALDDFALLDELNHLADAVGASSPTQDPLELINGGIRVGNITLRQLTLGRHEWFRAVAVPALLDVPDLIDAGLLWLMALPPNTDVRETDAAKLPKIVSRWAMSVDAPPEDLGAAAEQLLPRDRMLKSFTGTCPKCGHSDHAEPNYGPILAMIAREYHLGIDWLLWDAPISYLEMLCNDFMLRQKAEEDAQRSAAGAGARAPAMTERLRAVDELRKRAREIKEQRNAAA